ncbi:Uncharacterised protein [Vibrio cholerae]|nr:Uncharacterised protein [Vibrio cholerae]
MTQYRGVEVDDRVGKQSCAFIPDSDFRLVFATELITIHRRNGSSKEVPCFSPVQGTLHILPQTGIVDVVK